MMFIMYNGINAFNWDVFSWSIVSTLKTKTLNVSFRSEGTKVIGEI